MPAHSGRRGARAHPSPEGSAPGHGPARRHLLRAAIQSTSSYAAVFLYGAGAWLVAAPVASPLPSETPNTFGRHLALVVNMSIFLWRSESTERASQTHGRPRGRSSCSQAAHRWGLVSGMSREIRAREPD